MGHELIEIITHLSFQLNMVNECIAIIRGMNRDFDSIPWKDRARARQLLDKGLAEINNQPTRDKLQPIARTLFELLPDNERVRRGGSGLK